MTGADGRVSRAHGNGNGSECVKTVAAALALPQEQRNLAEGVYIIIIY